MTTSELITEAVKRGYTVSIGPHKDAPCGVLCTKGGETWGKGCDVDAEQIENALLHMPSIWNQ